MVTFNLEKFKKAFDRAELRYTDLHAAVVSRTGQPCSYSSIVRVMSGSRRLFVEEAYVFAEVLGLEVVDLIENNTNKIGRL